MPRMTLTKSRPSTAGSASRLDLLEARAALAGALDPRPQSAAAARRGPGRQPSGSGGRFPDGTLPPSARGSRPSSAASSRPRSAASSRPGSKGSRRPSTAGSSGTIRRDPSRQTLIGLEATKHFALKLELSDGQVNFGILKQGFRYRCSKTLTNLSCSGLRWRIITRTQRSRDQLIDTTDYARRPRGSRIPRRAPGSRRSR